MKGVENSIPQDDGYTAGGGPQKTSVAGDALALRAIDGYDTELRAINKKVRNQKTFFEQKKY